MIIEKIDKCQIDVVSGCNLRCIGCPNSTLRPPIKSISINNFDAMLKNIDVNQIRIFRLFNFGEPFLHPNLAQILEVIPRQSWKASHIEVSTNATVVDADKLKDVLSTKILTHLAVSCDGNCDKETFERLRPPAKWETLIEFLALAKRLRDKYSPKTSLITKTICHKTEAQSQWTSFLGKIGWRPTFRPMRVIADAEIIKDRKPDVPEGVCNWLYNPKKPKLYAKIDGTVVPCCTHPQAFVLGNLLQEKFSDIYMNPARLAMIKKMKNNRKAIPVCNMCEEI